MSTTRDREAAPKAAMWPIPFFLQQNACAVTIKSQKECLDEMQNLGWTWLSRVYSEVELWADLAGKLGKARTIPEVLSAYRDCASRRIQMAADDGRLLVEESQKIVAALTHVADTPSKPNAEDRRQAA